MKCNESLIRLLAHWLFLFLNYFNIWAVICTSCELHNCLVVQHVQSVRYVCTPATTWRNDRDRNARDGPFWVGEIQCDRVAGELSGRGGVGIGEERLAGEAHGGRGRRADHRCGIFGRAGGAAGRGRPEPVNVKADQPVQRRSIISCTKASQQF